MNHRRRLQAINDDRYLIEIPESALADIHETSYVSSSSDADGLSASDGRTPSTPGPGNVPIKDMSTHSVNSMVILRSQSQGNLNSSTASKAVC